MHRKNVLIIFIVLLLVNLVFAIPGIPHLFYGSITVNGQPAPDGTTIVAKINGIEVAATTTSGGKYGYAPLFYVPDTDPASRTGSTISFFVNNVDTGQTATFCQGCFNYCGQISTNCTLLDLTAIGSCGDTNCDAGESCSSCPGDCGTCPSSGGGGGGGGGITGLITSSETIEESAECTQSWQCTSWNPCSLEGAQTRVCTDVNLCEKVKRTESRECEYIPPPQGPGDEGLPEVEPEGLSIITGGVVLDSLGISSSIITLLVLLILLLVVFIVILVFRMRNKPAM